MPFLYRGETCIHYQWLHRGHKSNLLLINSLGTSLQLWDGVVPALLESFNILLFDKRGHGLSSTTAGPVSIDDYADDAIHLMDALGIARANVVGLSIGGLITYSLAVRYPERLDKLIFSNTGAKLGTTESWNDRIQRIEAGGIGAMSAQIIERWLSPAFRREQAAAAEGCLNMLERTSKIGYLQACAAIRDADFRPLLNEIRYPAMFMGGSEDAGTTPDLVRQNARDLEALRVEILEGVGHLPCVEQPAETARLIREFCTDVSTNPLTLEDRYRLGMQTRRSVLGDEHVDRAEANRTLLDTAFQEYIVHGAWGSVWSRPGLSKRDRSLITIALLTALGHDEELAMHLRATRNTGATEAEISEVLLHTSVYAGAPAANKALKTAKKVFREM